jgi:glucose-6-phosphate 1-dehydrogenase
MLGDQTLFTRGDEVESSWRVLTPVLEAWDAAAPAETIPLYEAGSWGPQPSDLLFEPGRYWRRL